MKRREFARLFVIGLGLVSFSVLGWAQPQDDDDEEEVPPPPPDEERTKRFEGGIRKKLQRDTTVKGRAVGSQFSQAKVVKGKLLLRNKQGKYVAAKDGVYVDAMGNRLQVNGGRVVGAGKHYGDNTALTVKALPQTKQ